MAKIKTDDAGAMMRQARKAAGDFGKFYTPECLSKLMARLCESGLRDRILDPACGCGSLLVYGQEVLGNAFYAGQEINQDSCELARKNLQENGVANFDIVCCNTLEDPVAWDEKFDVVLANPPFSVKWNPDSVPFDPRFNGVYAPKSKADLAFVQHGLYWLKDGGHAAYILPPGALSRSGAEEKIRAQFLPYVQAVIALPEKLFDETAIATVCVLFWKTEYEEPILFVDASDMIEAVNRKQNVIPDRKIDELVRIVMGRYKIEERSVRVERTDIKNFDLTPSRYIPKKVKENPCETRSTMDLCDEMMADAEYSYRLTRQLVANLRKEFGHEYNQEDLDFDVEAIKPQRMTA